MGMKLLIASDIHGSSFYCGKLIQRIRKEKPDKLLLLGDLLYHGPRNDLPEGYAPKEVIAMLSEYKEQIIAVRGNCEAEVDQMVLPFPCMADYTILSPEAGVEIFATHGHLWSPEKLPPLNPGTVFLYGHTHIKSSVWEGTNLTLNPGSVSIPKDGSHSYMTYENGVFCFFTLEGTLVGKTVIK